MSPECGLCGTPHISEPGGSLCRLRQKRRRANGLPSEDALPRDDTAREEAADHVKVVLTSDQRRVLAWMWGNPKRYGSFHECLTHRPGWSFTDDEYTAVLLRHLAKRSLVAETNPCPSSPTWTITESGLALAEANERAGRGWAVRGTADEIAAREEDIRLSQEALRLSQPDACVCGHHNDGLTYHAHLALAKMATGVRKSDEEVVGVDLDLVDVVDRKKSYYGSGKRRGYTYDRTYEINDLGRAVARCGRQPDMVAWIEEHFADEIANVAAAAAEEADATAARARDRLEAQAFARGQPISAPTPRPTGWVYAYAYPRDIELAETEPARSRVKVGCTTRSPAERVREQVSTSSPEAPRLLGEWPTPPGMSATEYERRVHALLDRHGLRIQDGGGAEWFRATIAQVDAVARYVGQFG